MILYNGDRVTLNDLFTLIMNLIAQAYQKCGTWENVQEAMGCDKRSVYRYRKGKIPNLYLFTKLCECAGLRIVLEKV